MVNKLGETASPFSEAMLLAWEKVILLHVGDKPFK